MKNYPKYFYLFVMLFLFSLFNSCVLREPPGNDIHIRFLPISFNGNWSFFQKGGIDKMQVLFNEDIFVNKADRIVLNENLRYSTDGLPYLPNLNSNKAAEIPAIGRDPVLENVETRFFVSTNENDFIPYINPVDQRLIHGTVNDISLFYNMNNTNLIDFKLTIDNSNVIVTSRADKRNYYVHWEQVKKSNYSIANSINFVVMAEGYREEQMHFFRKYVRHAFANSANFHYTEFRENGNKHVDNDFFAKWWNRINVFMFETISADEGIDTNFFHTRKKTFFNVNAGNKLSGNRTRMKRVISTMSKETNLHRDDIDVYILLVNTDSNIGAYSFAYAVSVDSSRNKQPVTFMVIQAPAGLYPENNISDYNINVRTSAIAHELGHAIARLSDEYPLDTTIKLPSMRNFSNSAGNSYKWQALIDVDSDYFDSNHPSVYNEDNRLVRRQLPAGVFVPTNNSTMRGGSKNGEKASNYQYGPVNTYFMEGSFMVRLGLIPAQDPRDRLNNQNNYQWSGYSFRDFHKNWPPSSFTAASLRK